MKKQKKILLQVLIFVIIVLSSCKVFAASIVDYAGKIELSEEYQKYLELDDEEKEKTIEPRMYEIPNTKRNVTNPLKLTRMLGASIDTKYSLQSVIPANMVIKNQQKTNSCWTFSSIGMLESTLALMDYRNGKSPVVYDYSERHMEYATSYVFKDGVNKNGFKRNVGNGGNSFVAIPYLTNGTGAILESDMPFENNEDTIELSKIQNKRVQTQVNDTIDFPSVKSTDDKTQIKQLMKEHIKNYGGIDATIYGANLSDTICYNNKTGAIYCDDSTEYPVNHAVLIVGWDDNYSKDNFAENKKPKNDGAWIIKNSWGTEIRVSLADMKNTIFNNFKDQCINNGWTSAELIPDETALSIYKERGYTIENNEAVFEIGDKGFMYVSYEDVNIYRTLTGITNAQAEASYDNIYQYDQYGGLVSLSLKVSKVYLGTVFNKKTTGTEYLTQISVDSPETYTCKVYVNPNGTSKAKSDLKQVQLKSGETETFDAGYHTIEFLNPIQITGENFVVVLEIQGTQTDEISLMSEFNYGEFFTSASESAGGHMWDNVTVESNKCFIATEEEFNVNSWTDTSNMKQLTDGKWPDFDTTIKAFTVSKLSNPILQGIEITTPPTKTSYEVGENFDKTGMVVKAKYSDGTSKEITDYIIKDGTNLTEGKTSVTIEYQGKTAMQKITVVKKAETATVVSISVKTMPIKIQYIQNKEKLDLTGGVIEVTYSDGSKIDVAMTSNDIIASGFNNKVIGKNTITITYKEKTAEFDVTIKEDSDTKDDDNNDNVKKPQNSNFDAMQGNVTRMRAYYFSDTSKKEYTIISVDINNINFANGNDNMEYYYYLSSNPQESNIQNWIKIDKFNTNDNKLSFEINTLDNSNYEEISNSDTLYLYIKEVATLNNTQQEKITSSLKLEVENINVEEYVDGKKKSDVDSGTIVNPTPGNKTDNKSNDTVEDNTTASGTIPKAGKGMIIIGIILILMVIGRITYLKYKDIQIK